MGINFETLVNNILEFDYAVVKDDKKGVDDKIQKIIKQFAGVNSSVEKELNAAYKKISTKSKLPSFIADTAWYSKQQIKGMEKEVLGIISKNFPDLKIKSKIQRQKALEDAFNKALGGETTEDLEKLIKEGVDINASQPFLKGKSLLAAAMDYTSYTNRLAMTKLIVYLLKNGANIPDVHRDGFIEKFFKEIKMTPELMDLLIAKGFDIDKDGTTAINADSLDSFIFLSYYGVELDPSLRDRSYLHSTRLECASIRHDALEELNKESSQHLTMGELTWPQRKAIAERALEISKFDEAWSTKYEKNPATLKMIQANEAFVEALEKNDFEQADKLLKEGLIHINARLGDSYTKNYIYSERVTLLTQACIEGDLKKVEWLLKAGANPRMGHHYMPSILAAAFSESQDRDAIMKLLKEAGGDVNVPLHTIPWVQSHFFASAMGRSAKQTWVEYFHPKDIIKALLQFGLTADLGPLVMITRTHSSESELKFCMALAFYGYPISEEIFKEFGTEKQQILRQAIELRDKLLVQFETEQLMEDPSLKVFSRDPLGVMAGYQPLIHSLRPELRLKLAEQCYAAWKPPEIKPGERRWWDV